MTSAPCALSAKERYDAYWTLGCAGAVVIVTLIALLPATFLSAQTWEVAAKSAIGPFVGAGLAFAGAMYLQSRTRIRENHIAGNLALLTISGQYNDFLVARKGIRLALAQRDRQSGGSAAAWLLAPFVTSHKEPRAVNLPSLSFLFDNEQGVRVYERIALLERHYEALFVDIEQMSLKAAEIQSRIAALAKASAAPPPTDHDFRVSVGFDVTQQAEDMLRGVLASLATEQAYLDAFNVLRDALRAKFPDRFGLKSIGPDEGSAESALPPIPAALKDRVPA